MEGKSQVDKILRILRNRLHPAGRRSSSSTTIDMRLTKLAASCNEYIRSNNIRPFLRILWPTTFNLSKIWWIHDGILAAALRLRGADIVPTMCDRLQSDECMFWGGVWQGSGKPGFRERRDAYCQQCIRYDTEMWERWGLRPLRLSSFVTAGEVREAQSEIAKLMNGDWQKLIWNGFAAGYEAWKAVVNNNLQAEIQDWWRQEAESLAYHHLLNIRLLLLAYERVFDVIAPDRVFGNGGFYYLWGVVDHIAKQRGVPYFRYHYIGLHPLAWNYARNSRELVDVGLAWESWLKQPWRREQEQRVEQNLAIWRSVTGTADGWGSENEQRMNLDLAKRGLRITGKSASTNENSLSSIWKQIGLNPDKPTALAAAGVGWDANTNVPSEAFRNMYDWLWETIRWFAGHPQWQLIIRVHPGEDIQPGVASEKRLRFEDEMRAQGIELPANVSIVPRTSPVSSHDLMKIATLGMVYTSTTGLEMACTGLPVIVVGPVRYRGKGFTLDPHSRDEYSATLTMLLSGDARQTPEERSQRAKRYWYLYAYHGSVVTGLVELDKDGEQVPRELTYHDLLPGANPYLDYICDSVINDLPIMGENRWPPERQEQPGI